MKRRFFHSLFNRAIAANEAMAVACSVNEQPLPESAEQDQWVQISPYGEFPTGDGKFIQVVDRTAAEKMVSSFNSLLGKAGRMWRGVPIYVGHPDVQPKDYPDRRRYGKITDLEAREDGLYGKVEWNDLGKQNLTEGYFVYPSPAWYYAKPKDGQQRISPVELKSVGMTNTPNIDEVTPWTNEATTQEDTDIMNKEAICKLLGLDPATATDEQIQAALSDLKAKADAAAAANAALEAEKQKAAEAEAAKTQQQEAFANERKAHAQSRVDVAINEGRISEADRATWEAKFIADVSAAQAELDKHTKPAINSKPVDIARRVDIGNTEQRRAAIQLAVNERMKAANESYEKAYLAVKNDPQYSALFQPQQQAA